MNLSKTRVEASAYALILTQAINAKILKLRTISLRVLSLPASLLLAINVGRQTMETSSTMLPTLQVDQSMDSEHLFTQVDLIHPNLIAMKVLTLQLTRTTIWEHGDSSILMRSDSTI